MGKIRIKTLGIDEIEKQQKKEAKKRQEAKKIDKKTDGVTAPDAMPQSTNTSIDTPTVQTTERPVVETKKINKKFASAQKKKHSSRYQTIASYIDSKRIYSLKDALILLPKLQRAKSDESVELHINTQSVGISVNTDLPHGTGKTIRVAIASDEIIHDVEKGHITFDILIAEPNMMPKLAKVAKILGPKGLMPNPKNGTVTSKPQDLAEKFASGKVQYKTETKFPLLHMTIGKISFGEQKLSENIHAIASALPANLVKNATIKLTMSPGIPVDYTSL